MFTCTGSLFCAGCSAQDYGDAASTTHNQDVVIDNNPVPNDVSVYYELVSDCNGDLDLGILRTDNNPEVVQNRYTLAYLRILMDDKNQTTELKSVLQPVYDQLKQKDDQRKLGISVPYQHIISYQRFTDKTEFGNMMTTLGCGGCSFRAYRVDRETGQRTLVEEN